jgi:hypothetical protein
MRTEKNKMKRVAYIFLLVFLLSCGSRSELQGNRIKVLFRDSTTAEYHLVAVRDSTLLVTSDFSNENKLIEFSKVDRIYHNVDGKSIGKVLGGLVGFGVGSLTAFTLFPLSDGSGIDMRRGLLIIPTTITGAIVGFALSKDDKGFDLSDPIDKSSVKGFSKFPFGEPPELQKIK